MTEIIHVATNLTSSAEVRGSVRRVSYEPPYPQDGDPMLQVLWIAGTLQLMLDVKVEIVETEADQFDVRFVDGDSSWIRYYGPFDLHQLRAYLRGIDDGYKFVVDSRTPDTRKGVSRVRRVLWGES